jgi:hypothetical protein
MIKKLIGLMLCLISVLAFAQKEVVMTGAGAMTCKKYMDTVQPLNNSEKEIITNMYEAWIQGYLTGRNRQLDLLGHKMIDIGNVEQFGAMISFACVNLVKQGAGGTPLFMLVDKVYEDAFSNTGKKK